MKATEISDVAACKAHCDWIIEHAKEIKALLEYNSEEMIVANKTRAISSIDTMMDSLRELKCCIEEITQEKSFDDILADANKRHKEIMQDLVDSGKADKFLNSDRAQERIRNGEQVMDWASGKIAEYERE